MSEELSSYYESIPIGRENAISKYDLMKRWNMNERQVRRLITKLRCKDNGDDMVIVSTSKHSGYYRTNDRHEIKQFKLEMSNRAKHTFRPLRKATRILGVNEDQVSFNNNLKIARLNAGLKSVDVVELLKQLDHRFDKSLLSKIENGVCMPTQDQLSVLSTTYGKPIHELIGTSFMNYE